MKLYIAEKPSLGRAIAAALPKPQKNHPGYIELANGDVVSWCIGHILEQVQPEVYDEKFKKWQFDHLPIVPEQWKLQPKIQTRKQLTLLKKLIIKADELIHAGDPDREGQLLVDEVIDYVKVAKKKKSLTKRLLISDLNVAAVKRALNQMKPNSDFMPLSISALARSRADWLYGINLTRAYTIQGKKAGFKGVLSVGRVQTPLLGLVVNRDLTIENFIEKPFYQVLAHITDGVNKASTNQANANQDDASQTFTAKWQPSEQCQPYMDEDNHVLIKGLAENVVTRITNQPAVVTSAKYDEKSQAAPLPYNLSSLQIDAAKRFSMNAKLVLDVCQGLYEKHKLITYPRSDCRFLPLEHFKQAPTILSMLSSTGGVYALSAKNADSKIKSKAWNDKKVSAHHAIIPTEKSPKNINLNGFEQNVYQLIIRQYLAQFYPAYIYHQTNISLAIAGGVFSTQAKSPVNQGWKVLFDNKNVTEKSTAGSQNNEAEQKLPLLKQGDVLHCSHGQLLEKMTQAPQAFTDATLLAAMTGINRYVEDTQIKKILKDSDGLGTEATRAGIIELLFQREYLQRQGKQIKATEIGKGLIAALPEMVSKPDMTAQWESILTAISEKKNSYQNFMLPLEQTLTQVLNFASAQNPTQLAGLGTAKKFVFKGKKRVSAQGKSQYKTKKKQSTA